MPVGSPIELEYRQQYYSQYGNQALEIYSIHAHSCMTRMKMCVICSIRNLNKCALYFCRVHQAPISYFPAQETQHWSTSVHKSFGHNCSFEAIENILETAARDELHGAFQIVVSKILVVNEFTWVTMCSPGHEIIVV